MPNLGEIGKRGSERLNCAVRSAIARLSAEPRMKGCRLEEIMFEIFDGVRCVCGGA